MARPARGLAALLTLGVVAAGCDFDGAYDLPLPGSVVDEDEAFEVTAQFRDVLNVVPRSPVKVDDVTVGEVTEVDRVGWQARVRLRVREDVDLPDNAIAEIRQTSLLGEKYVALEPPPDEQPSPDRLGEGDEIALPATGRNPEVEEVLGALSFLLTGGGVAQLGTITSELNQVMSGREDRVRSLLGNLDDVVGTLDDQKGEIIRAMRSVNRLSATLNAERETITDALDVMGPAVSVLADQHEQLLEMLGSLRRLSDVGTRVINASRDDLLATLRELEPVLEKLNEAGDSLAPGFALMASFPFPKEASEVVKGDFANTEIKLDVSLENLEKTGLPDLEGLLDGLGRGLGVPRGGDDGAPGRERGDGGRRGDDGGAETPDPGGLLGGLFGSRASWGGGAGDRGVGLYGEQL